MDSCLLNQTVYIGRSSDDSKLMVYGEVNGLIKAAKLTQQAIPICVSRCKPEQFRAHCKIDIATDGTLHLTKLVDENIVMVNGLNITTMSISITDKVLLGCDNYQLNLSAVIDAAKKLFTVPIEEIKEVSIAPLEHIYNDYHAACIKLKKDQRLVGNIRLAVIFLGSIGSVLGMVGGAHLILFITFPALAWCTYKSFTDKGIEKQEALTENFQDTYICPKCKKYVGSVSYKILKQKDCCPHCKVKWLE